MTEQTFDRRFVTGTPVFYGWVVWAIATLGLIATSPGQTYSVSLFIDYMIDDLGIGRTAISTLYSLATLFASFSLTWMGRQIDYYGNRRVNALIVAGFAGGLVFMSLVVHPVMVLIGFMLIRGLGQGSLGMASTTVVAQWFKRRRGLVMSFTLVFFAGWQALYVPWLEATLRQTDWRQMWLILAGVEAAIILPLTWLLLRNKPEDYDMLPDNDREQSEADGIAALQGWNLRQALRTPIFWVFLSGRIIVPAWVTGVIFHQVDLFEELGYDSATAAATFAQLALFGALISLPAGSLIDRFRPGWIMTLQMAAIGGGMALATMMTVEWMLTVYAFLLAISLNTGGIFDGVAWVNLYGRKHQGEIRGFVTTVLVTGTAIGPVLFAVSHDLFGSYDAVLWLGCLLAATPMVLSPLMPEPDITTSGD